MGRVRMTEYPMKRKKKKEVFVPADPRCAECHYWRYFGGVTDESTYCCHYVLMEGKMRCRISETECGSFAKKGSIPERRMQISDVPMTQWGCGGLGYVRKGER